MVSESLPIQSTPAGRRLDRHTVGLKGWKGDDGRAGLTIQPVSLTATRPPSLPRVLAYGVVSEKLSPTSLLGDAVETFVRREAAERFIEEVQRDDRLIRARGPAGGGRSRVLREHSLKQALEARARERGLSLTAAVVALLERGLDAT